MAEWSNAPDSKSGIQVLLYRGFESLSLRQRVWSPCSAGAFFVGRMQGVARGCGGLGNFSRLSQVPEAAILGGPGKVFSQARDSADPDRAESPHLPAMWSIAQVTDGSTAQPCTGQSVNPLPWATGHARALKLRQRTKVLTAAGAVCHSEIATVSSRHERSLGSDRDAALFRLGPRLINPIKPGLPGERRGGRAFETAPRRAYAGASSRSERPGMEDWEGGTAARRSSMCEKNDGEFSFHQKRHSARTHHAE